MIGLIKELNNQIKSLTKVITEICSSDDKLVLSQKKEKILKILNSAEYQEQQKKIELMLKLARRYYAEDNDNSKNPDDLMEIDSIIAQLALCKRGIESRDSEMNSKKMKEGDGQPTPRSWQ